MSPEPTTPTLPLDMFYYLFLTSSGYLNVIKDRKTTGSGLALSRALILESLDLYHHRSVNDTEQKVEVHLK